MDERTDTKVLATLTQQDLMKLSEWQGSVRQALIELTGVVKQLSTSSVSKSDMKEFKDSVEKTIDRLERMFSAALDKLPCKDNATRLTSTERELDRLGVAFKIKSSAWGLLGGLIPTVGAVLWMLLQS